MTAPRRDGSEEAWNRWIRLNPRLDSREAGLSVQNSDLWIHRYLTKVDRQGTREIQHLMLVEWKAFGATVPFAQADTFALVDVLLRSVDGKRVQLPGQAFARKVRVWGVHVVRMDGADPGTSEQIWWDKKLVTVTELEELLRFERDPFTLRPRSDRRHHAPSEADKLQLHLSAKAAGRTYPTR